MEDVSNMIFVCNAKSEHVKGECRCHGCLMALDETLIPGPPRQVHPQAEYDVPHLQAAGYVGLYRGAHLAGDHNIKVSAIMMGEVKQTD